MNPTKSNEQHYWNALHSDESERPQTNVPYQVKVMFCGKCFYYCAYWNGKEWLDESGHEFEVYDLIVGFRNQNKDFEE